MACTSATTRTVSSARKAAPIDPYRVVTLSGAHRRTARSTVGQSTASSSDSHSGAGRHVAARCPTCKSNKLASRETSRLAVCGNYRAGQIEGVLLRSPRQRVRPHLEVHHFRRILLAALDVERGAVASV